MHEPTRRRVLAALAVPVVGGRPRSEGGSVRAAVTAGRDAGQRAEPFRPAVHGFGFPNWSTAAPTFPDHAHEAVTEEQVRRTISRTWQGPLSRTLGLGVLPTHLLDVVGTQVYVSVNQRSATNGHCYGMAFAAQRYYEAPEALPLGRTAASEFTHPDEPLDDPESPVGREIDLYQNTQFLDFFAWVGRRVMFTDGWVDLGGQLANLTAALDRYGTAGITRFDTDSRRSHQVLVHGYRRRAGGTTLFVYDPNRPARRYGRDSDPTIEVDTNGDTPSVRPDGTGYDSFVYNRYDRIIAARNAAEPLDGIGRSADALRDRLFTVALFLVDDPDVRLTVVDPDGRPVRRDVSSYVDRRHTEHHWMRYRYGARPGRYRAVVAGADETEYALEVRAASAAGTLLDVRRSAGIEAGEVHEYAVDVPDSPADGGSVERVTGPSTGVAAGIGLGAAGLAAGGYALYRRRSGGDG